MMKRCAELALLGLLVSGPPAFAQSGVEDIVNFRQYSPTYASAGQPDVDQMAAVRDAGFERVIYVAYSDQERSLPNEDRVVKSLGMEYVHIPVEWDAPTTSDFAMFAAAMQSAPKKKTLLHCQVNYRASAFSFLYRVIYDGVDLASAKADMDTVWTPNETWRGLIFDVLAEHGLSPNCEGCDWSVAEM